jgi:hypothetical protein
MEDVQEGKRLARLTRRLENLPVWTSSMLLGLTRNGRVGYLQLHWPEIPAPVAHEAHRLAYRVDLKWAPPDLPGSKVEAVEAGTIHSPAVGFLMDIYPVVRVIYRGVEDRLGKKAVLYTVTPPSGDSILVLSLDVQELLAGGCSPLSKHVHALFTAYHPYLGTCQVYLEGPGIPPPAAVNPAIDPNGQALSPGGGQDFNISTLGPCAYIVWISATLRLTVGYGAVYGTFYDHIAFCIR